MSREFDDFIVRRYRLLSFNQKQAAAACHVSEQTLIRLRADGPIATKADQSTKDGIAAGLRFGTWSQLLAAFRARDPAAGLPVDNLSRDSQLKVNKTIELVEEMLRTPIDAFRRSFFGGLPADSLALLLTRVAEHAAAKLVNGQRAKVGLKVAEVGTSERPEGNPKTQDGTT